MSMDDITKRLLDKIDKLQDQIQILCDRATRQELALTDHFSDLKRSEGNRERKFYYVIALMDIAFTVFQLIQSLR